MARWSNKRIRDFEPVHIAGLESRLAISQAEAARISGRTLATVKGWCRSGELPTIKIKNRTLIPKFALEIKLCRFLGRTQQPENYTIAAAAKILGLSKETLRKALAEDLQLETYRVRKGIRITAQSLEKMFIHSVFKLGGEKDET